MNNTEMLIADNIGFVREKIEKAAGRSGRKAADIKLMAVTKFRSIEEIKAAHDAGIRLFGENRVQEALEKFGRSGLNLPDSSLHMIGNLQRNKVKTILPLVSCIQSVDRIELLEEIAKRLSGETQQSDTAPFDAASRPLKLLFEVHTGEESKSGFTCSDDIVRSLEYAEEKNLCVCGFMTMAPLIRNPADKTEAEAVRRSFIKLRETAEAMQKRFACFSFTELSMGMSGDFETAVEEGSTLVRVGSRLFYNPDSENRL
ncbi:YggS family pyridoxal phosphate-dependent enzyme [Treponema sp. OMZ 840]|uniref:YggS family pyridoxal phosphate-dependent enzyme n=1 Tax=Treponema sp. OMZ 840 TaxID=244313 RepID=UPI003D8CA03E